MEPRNHTCPRCRRCFGKWKATSPVSSRREAEEPRAVVEPQHVQKHLTREPGDPVAARLRGQGGPRWEVSGRTPPMYGHGKSDRRVVPTKLPNKGHQRPAEAVEGSRLAKGNLSQQSMHRTQSRARMSQELERVRQAAKQNWRCGASRIGHPVLSSAWTLGPKAGAQCGSSACSGSVRVATRSRTSSCYDLFTMR